MNEQPYLGRKRKEAARRLRYQGTPTEELLWRHLRDRQLEGFKFRRQHPIGPYFVDFYCHEKQCIIEVDGPIHKQQVAKDDERQAYLEALGLRVIRVGTEAMESHIDAVLSRVREALRT